MNTKNVMITEDSNTAGALIWWELTGKVDYASLTTEWTAAGLDPALLPELPSALSALHRAVHDFAGKRTLARRLDAGHWALVEEAIVGVGAGKKPSYIVHITARLSDDPAHGATDDNPALIIEPEHNGIRERFEEYKAKLDTNDVSNWLIKRCVAHAAVSLRKLGGLYFVPRGTLDQFRAEARALEKASGNNIWRAPALRAEEAVAAVLAGITAEAEAEAARFEEALIEGKLGERGLNNRVGDAQKMKAKLAHYEELLGVSLGALGEKLERLRANLAAAALMAAADESEAA